MKNKQEFSLKRTAVIHKSNFYEVDNPLLSTFAVDNLLFYHTA